jgi:hypothetical protein
MLVVLVMHQQDVRQLTPTCIHNNLFYTFSACCDGSTFSFRRGDIELGSDYVNGTTMYLTTVGTGGTFDGCATVMTGYTGSTIYTDNNCTFSYLHHIIFRLFRL